LGSSSIVEDSEPYQIVLSDGTSAVLIPVQEVHGARLFTGNEVEWNRVVGVDADVINIVSVV